MLLLSCKACSANYFSAASAGSCPDCGAELGPGSPARLPAMDLDGNGRGANGNGTGSEFDRLWQLLAGEEPLHAATPRPLSGA